MNKFQIKHRAAASLMLLILTSAGHAGDKYLYYWSDYRGDLSGKDSEAKLLHIIKKSEESGRKIAPGLQAEYGYMFYARGNFDTAILWFGREARTWPESSVLMRRMIERAREGSVP